MMDNPAASQKKDDFPVQPNTGISSIETTETTAPKNNDAYKTIRTIKGKSRFPLRCS